MNYPVALIPDDNNSVMARFVDFPGASFGDDADDALARSVALLETILTSYIDDRRELPTPSPAAGRPVVGPTLLGTMKVAVYQAMRARLAQGRPRPRAPSRSAADRPPARPAPWLARRADRGGAGGVRAYGAGRVGGSVKIAPPSSRSQCDEDGGSPDAKLAGTVSAVHVAEGDQVGDGMVLVEIEAT